jgi:hypothetical protein
MRKSKHTRKSNPIFKQIRGKFTETLVLEDPTLREIVTLMKLFTDKVIEGIYPLRAIVTERAVYVWPGISLLHGEVAEHLDEKIIHRVEIFYLVDKGEWKIDKPDLAKLFKFLK